MKIVSLAVALVTALFVCVPAHAQGFTGPYGVIMVGSADREAVEYGSVVIKDQDTVYRGALGWGIQSGPLVGRAEFVVQSPQKGNGIIFTLCERGVSGCTADEVLHENFGSDGGVALMFHGGYEVVEDVLLFVGVGVSVEQVYDREVITRDGAFFSEWEKKEVSFGPIYSAGVDWNFGQEVFDLPVVARFEYTHSNVKTPGADYRAGSVTYTDNRQDVTDGLWLGVIGKIEG